jgi:glutamate carboxypeptidase
MPQRSAPPSEPTAQILGFLRKREAQMACLLERFVRAESPTDRKAAVDRFGKIVASEWRKRDARVEILRQRDAGDHLRVNWAPQANGAGQILVLGHLDTVYELGTLARMPFRVARGRAFGPGTFDMKAGLVIALFAADALRQALVRPKKRIVFLWTSDEETGSASSRALIEREARRSEAALVLEPAAGKYGALKTQRKAVGTAEITIRGRATHAGLNPQEGVNAVHEMALQITRLAQWSDPRRGISVSPTVASGGSRSNVIPDVARIEVDLRAACAGDARAIEGKLRALRPILPGAQVEVRGGFTRPPLERTASAALFARAARLAGGMGLALREAATGGGSDGNFTAALGVPTLDGLGAVGDGAHSKDEHVVVRSLPERAALLAALLADLSLQKK